MTPLFLNQFVKYMIVGGSAALVNWGVFYASMTFLHFYYMLAGLISFVLATLWNFIWARKFIFGDCKHSLFKESFLVYGVSLGGLLIDMGVLYVCVEIFSLYVLLGKICATGTAFIFNFSLRYFVIYKQE